MSLRGNFEGILQVGPFQLAAFVVVACVPSLGEEGNTD